MRITKIEKQKRERDRYNIFINDEFAFGLYGDTVINFSLAKDDEVNEKDITKIREFDEVGFGKRIAYSYLSYKPRSKKEIIKKLKEKKISAVSIEKIVQLLEGQKYIDDETYARNFLESKTRGKAIGKRLMQKKLREKGIPNELATIILAENFPGERETALASELLKKYLKRIKYKNDLDKKNKSFRYLISRGFDYETAVRAIASAVE